MTQSEKTPYIGLELSYEAIEFIVAALHTIAMGAVSTGLASLDRYEHARTGGNNADREKAIEAVDVAHNAKGLCDLMRNVLIMNTILTNGKGDGGDA